MNSNWRYSPEMVNSGKNRRFFVLCDLEISWMILKNNRAPLLCCFKLCASFHSHQWIKTKFTVRKCLIRVKISISLSCVTLKFDGWPWKSIGHLFYATLSYVHHFSKPLVNWNWSYSPKTLNSGKNRPFFPVWPWNLTDDLTKQMGTSFMLLQALCIIW